jgi:manganese transport protein
MKASQPSKRSSSLFWLLGPAFVAAIAYVDPGNFATNFSGGAAYGYALIWVLILANAMAGLVQYLSAKAGLVTGKSLPELVRDTLGPKARFAYWVQAEAVAIATDLAEVIGGAIALTLLFGLPLLISGIITGILSFLMLAVQTYRGQRSFEWVIIAFLLGIGVCMIGTLFFTHISLAGVASGFKFSIPGKGGLLLIAGIFGATIMPHVVYLHSALARDRHGKAEDKQLLSRLLSATRLDVFIAMLIAGGINIAMLLFAAAALFHAPGADTLTTAYGVIAHVLSPMAATLFACALLISGLASTSVGSYAGAVVMEGLMGFKLSIFARRAITLIPALALLALPLNPTTILILSQVILSFGIPFAVIPLVMLTANKRLMGDNANNQFVNAVALLITVFIIVLNVTLLVLTFI